MADAVLNIAIEGVAQALRDHSGGFGIARRALHFGEPVEKIVNQLAFLRCHRMVSLAEKRGGECRGALCRQ